MTGGERDALLAEARELLERARRAGLQAELARLFSEQPATPSADGAEAAGRFGMIGACEGMQRVFALIEKLKDADVPVLVLGETGTGKELVARALHEHGARKGKPFQAVNCAAIPAELLESELFGHKKGAFTGAVADRVGQFVAADGGTLFLDEIGDMPLAMQAKLLRVLQEGEVRPVGDNRVRRVDVRVVAATHKDLATAAREGRFREDLLYRLNVVAIRLPALRERGDDVVALAEARLASLGASMGRSGVRLTERAKAALRAHAWPGNVRELENELQRALALSDGDIDLEDLSAPLRAAATRVGEGASG